MAIVDCTSKEMQTEKGEGIQQAAQTEYESPSKSIAIDTESFHRKLKILKRTAKRNNKMQLDNVSNVQISNDAENQNFDKVFDGMANEIS